jgi:hypothetical protein
MITAEAISASRVASSTPCTRCTSAVGTTDQCVGGLHPAQPTRLVNISFACSCQPSICALSLLVNPIYDLSCCRCEAHSCDSACEPSCEAPIRSLPTQLAANLHCGMSDAHSDCNGINFLHDGCLISSWRHVNMGCHQHFASRHRPHMQVMHIIHSF